MLYINSIAATTGPSDVASLLNGAGCKSILDSAYLKETGNVDFKLGRSNQVVTSSELAAQVAHEAIERSEFSLEDIGLVIADTTSPHELIPSEAQRTAKALGHKVASFDIGTGGLGIPGLLQPLSCWRKERLEKPILCVSAHVPTLSTTIERQKNGVVFADAAVAFIVSQKESGFLLEQNSMQVLPKSEAILRVPVNGQLELFEEKRKRIPVILQEIAAALKLGSAERKFVSSYGVELPEEMESSYHQHGESLGASPAVALESSLADIQAGERFALLSPGCGVMTGGCLLKKL